MFLFGLPLQFLSQGFPYPETSLGRVGVCSLFSNNFLFSLFFEVQLLLHVPVPWEQCPCSGCRAVAVPLGAVPGHAAHWKCIAQTRLLPNL